MTEYNQFSFSGTLVHLIVFRLKFFCASLMRKPSDGLLRINFQLNSIHQFPPYNFRLQQFFNILISSDFAHIPSLDFPRDVVDNG